MIDFNNLYKIRIANPDKSFEKHEIVKLLLVMKLLTKHKREKRYVHIYTEFVIKDGKKADVYYENLKEKSAYIFEIQKEDSKIWKDEIMEFYKDFNVASFKTTDLIIIRLKDLDNDLIKLSEQLETYIL